MNLVRPLFSIAVLAWGSVLAVAAPQEAPPPPPFEGVRLAEETWEIPTYPVGPPEVNPVFFDGRQYQGARGPVYPYPLLDKLSTVKEPRSYRVLVLENRFVSISVVPELGGRIFTGQDKTNGYDFFYRQHVIKPALIGMTGAWISGGVEWNVFHHHRATSFMPVDHAVEAHPDGSKTIWVGEIELRHRMKWLVGLTLHPDRSCIEQTVKLLNRTPLAHSFLYFANPAVHANERYQVIFPPRTRWATFHGKTEFVAWPKGDGPFRGVDYRGVDLSWWKSHPRPVSFFAVNEEDSFLAGYDHGREAGLVHVADPLVVPGKKLWEWGDGPEGRTWDGILTDADGPYIELMVGAYSDNQPDYSWLQPGEVKVFRQYWYPIRGIGGVKAANREAAVNLEVKGGRVRLAFAATAEHPGARALLWAGEQPIVSEPVAVGPGRPYSVEVALPAGAREEELRAVLVGAGGRELIAYTPAPAGETARPPAYRPPPPPAEIATVEELYLAGSRLDQLYSPHAEPDAYYEEALRRDPGDTRSNTALGLLHLKRGRVADAERHFRAAAARATANHTKARSAEPLYYLGVVLQSQGRLEEARAVLGRAAWDRAWTAPASLLLAEIACARGEPGPALEAVDRALAANALDPRAHGLRAAILRGRGEWREAAAAAAEALRLDPLDFLAGHERVLALEGTGAAADAKAADEALRALMRGHVPSHVELALDYARAGLLDDAIAVASRLVPGDDDAAASPLLLYLRADLRERRSDPEGAARDAGRAKRQGPAGVFPWAMEMAGVFERAMHRDPRDARAPYYLGTLLYDHQPDRAIALWEGARDLDPSFPTVHRNLAFGLARRPGGLTAAVASQEKAVELDGGDPTLLLELDRLYERARVGADARLATLESHRDTVRGRDRTIAREARLLVQVGREDEALELLRATHFHVWEGEAGVHGLYVEALLRRGRRALAAGRAAAARTDFLAALEHPGNMEEGRAVGADEPRVRYHLGLAEKALGRRKEARSGFAAAAAAAAPGETAYYRALALRELGRKAEAEAVLEEVAAEARRRQGSAEGHYLAALTLLARGDRGGAEAAVLQALRRDPNHLGALGLAAGLP